MLNTETVSSAHTNPAYLGAAPSSFSHCRPLSILIFDLESLIFLSVNDTAVEQYGYSREEFLAMTFKDLLQKERIAQFLSHSRSTPKVLMNTSIWKHQKKNGNTIDVAMSCYKFIFQGKHAMLVLSKEITEPEKPKGTLARELQKYQIGTVRFTDIISRVDRRLMFLELNREIDKLTGMTANAIVESDKGLGGIIPSVDAEYLQPCVIDQDGSTGLDSDSQGAINLPMRAWFPSWEKVIGSFYAQCIAGVASLPPRILSRLQQGMRQETSEARGEEPEAINISKDARYMGRSKYPLV
ncbi:MAG: PAS domain-containing protein [Gammaproteobacteria bacterium]